MMALPNLPHKQERETCVCISGCPHTLFCFRRLVVKKNFAVFQYGNGVRFFGCNR